MHGGNSDDIVLRPEASRGARRSLLLGGLLVGATAGCAIPWLAARLGGGLPRFILASLVVGLVVRSVIGWLDRWRYDARSAAWVGIVLPVVGALAGWGLWTYDESLATRLLGRISVTAALPNAVVNGALLLLVVGVLFSRHDRMTTGAILGLAAGALVGRHFETDYSHWYADWLGPVLVVLVLGRSALVADVLASCRTPRDLGGVVAPLIGHVILGSLACGLGGLLARWAGDWETWTRASTILVWIGMIPGTMAGWVGFEDGWLGGACLGGLISIYLIPLAATDDLRRNYTVSVEPLIPLEVAPALALAVVNVLAGGGVTAQVLGSPRAAALTGAVIFAGIHWLREQNEHANDLDRWNITDLSGLQGSSQQFDGLTRIPWFGVAVTLFVGAACWARIEVPVVEAWLGRAVPLLAWGAASGAVLGLTLARRAIDKPWRSAPAPHAGPRAFGGHAALRLVTTSAVVAVLLAIPRATHAVLGAALFLDGQTLSLVGSPGDVLECLARAEAHGCRCLDWDDARADAARRLARWPLAMTDLDRHVERATGRSRRCDALVARGKLRGELGEHQAAVADFTLALAARSNRTDALVGRAQALVRLSLLEAAERDVQRALQLAPDDRDTLLEQARLHAARGDFDSAVRAFTTLLDRDSEFIAALRGRATVRRNAGQLSLAMADLKQALHLEPLSAVLHGELGLVELEAGDLAAASDHLRTSLERDPSLVSVRVGRGRCLSATGFPAEALRELNEAVRQAPEDESAYHWRAQVYEQLGEASAAEADRQVARRLGAAQHSQREAERAAVKTSLSQ